VRYTNDGKSIVFIGYAESQLRLYRVSANGGEVEPISMKAATEPDLSSDGKLLACAFDYGKDAMNAPLGIISLADGKVTTLQTSGMRYEFRPGAKDVTFVREDGATTQNLWMQSLRGGEPRRLTNFEEGSIADYEWSADGKRLAGTHVVQSSDVVLIRR
jgi:Tol biopolymer transport system component